jgi:hypothetical protein
VWLVGDPLLGLLAGKIVADIVFSVVAAGAFTASNREGLRGDAPRTRLRAGVARRRAGLAA